MFSPMQKQLLKVVLDSVGISDPRTSAAIISLAGAKFNFTNFPVKAEPKKLSLSLGGTIDEKDFSLSVELTGEIADELQEIAAGLVSRAAVPIPGRVIELPASSLVPAAEGAGSDFLA